MKRAEMAVRNNLSMIRKAATWVRKKYNIPDHCTIQKEFELEFNCTLVALPTGWTVPDQIYFNTAADMTLFLLRWS